MINVSDIYPRVYFSGRKGFAIYLDFKAVKLEKTHDVIRHFVTNLKDKLELQTVDFSVVGDLRRLSRIPYTKHLKSGLYCTPITIAEIVQGITLTEILEKAKNPDFTDMAIRLSTDLRKKLLDKDLELSDRHKMIKKLAENYIPTFENSYKKGIRKYIQQGIEHIAQMHGIPHAYHFVLAICAELLNNGFSVEETVQLFLESDPKRAYKQTKYYVEYAKKRNCKPYKKATLEKYGYFKFLRKMKGGENGNG